MKLKNEDRMIHKLKFPRRGERVERRPAHDDRSGIDVRRRVRFDAGDEVRARIVVTAVRATGVRGLAV